MSNSPLFDATMRMCDALFGPEQKQIAGRQPPRAHIDEELPPPAPEAFAPTADQLIALVACNYGVGPDMAAKWLRDCFGPVLT